MKNVRYSLLAVALIGLSAFVNAQTTVDTSSTQAQKPAQSDMTTAVTPAVLGKVPTLLFAEEVPLPQGVFANIAIVSKDMSLDESLKILNSTMPGRGYTRIPEQEAKVFIEAHQQKIQQSFDKAGAVREHLTTMAVARTQKAEPQKITQTASSSASSSGSGTN